MIYIKFVAFSRGPNKYTRTWEDEAAYAKAPLPARTKKQVRPKKSNEEFPPLVNTDSVTVTPTIVDKKKDQPPPRRSQEK